MKKGCTSTDDGRRFSTKSNFRPDDGSLQNTQSGDTNDPSWYSRDAAIARDASTIPFSWSTGLPINFHNPLNPDAGELCIPGIMVISTRPSLGKSVDAQSALNVASTAIYTYVRHVNSGHTNYDHVDLMIYLMAMSQVYSYLNYLQRIYGCATLYSQNNRYMPNALLEAQGVNTDDLQRHLADYRYGVNVLINKIASLAVPATIPLFAREAFMYRNIYQEPDSLKNQMYMYSPTGFWFFTYDADGAGKLEFTRFTKYVGEDGLMTVDSLLKYGSDMIDVIISNEDMNIMSGDILHAYGQNILRLQSLPEYYPIAPVFDIAVLEQMKNSTLVGQGFLEGSSDVIQSADKGYLIYNPLVKHVRAATDQENITMLSWLSADRILTTTTANVDSSLIMESTRMMAVGDYSNRTVVDESTYIPLYCGSEIAERAILWQYLSDGNAVSLVHHDYELNMSLEGMNADYARAKWALASKSHFRFAPLMIMHWNTFFGSNTENNMNTEYLFDVDNYAVMSVTDLRRMHEAAMLNMLNVPLIAKSF